MTDLFTQEELADALQVDTATVNANFYARVLANITGRLQGLVGHPIFVTTDDVTVMQAAGLPVLQLPHWPVTAISSVVVDTTTLVATDYSFTRLGQLTRRTHHRCFPSGWRHGWGFAPVTVTYTHGYAAIPAPLKEVALELAVMGYANPQGFRAETIGGYSYSYSTASGRGLTDYHQQILADYR